MDMKEAIERSACFLEEVVGRLRGGEFHRKLDKLLNGNSAVRIEFHGLHAVMFVPDGQDVSPALKVFECQGKTMEGIYYRGFQVPY